MTSGTQRKKLVCLSHLAWDRGLFQRPQQLMTQFSFAGIDVDYFGCVGLKNKKHFSCNGEFAEGGKFANVSYSPFSRFPLHTFLAHRLLKRIYPAPVEVLWLTNPLFSNLVPKIEHKTLVLDFMDPFFSFENSVKHEMLSSYQALLLHAKIVFTGGESMHKQLLEHTPDEHKSKLLCLPSAVDWEHFAKATSESTTPYSTFDGRRPVWGYFGAIDERIDVKLIVSLCKANTTGVVVLAGPNINPFLSKQFDLPSNLVLTGRVQYDCLPNLLKTFDVCLLPFKDSELVRHISPTKTPEYLAGHKPVVSMNIPDVVKTWGTYVNCASTHKEFIDLCLQAHNLSADEYMQIKSKSVSWTDTASRILDLLNIKEMDR